MEENSEIFCEICKKKIDKNVDNYARITDYASGKLMYEKFYHELCWHEKILGLKKNKDKQEEVYGIMKKLDVILTNLTGISEVRNIK